MRSAAISQPQMRNRILEVAEELFRAHGYSKTTVADIAKACEMSPANVYRFFESKSALHEAITGVVLQRLEELAQSIARERRPASERLKRLLLETHSFACQQYLKDEKVHEIVVKALDEQWAIIDAHIQRIRLLYNRIIEDGVRDGEFTVRDVEEASECVFNAIWVFCHPQIVAERFAADRGRQATAMGEFLVRALRG